MNEDKWIYVDKRTNNLVLRFYVKGFPKKQFYISSSLEDTPKNRAIVRERRDWLLQDIRLGRFDASLKSYQFTGDANNPVRNIEKEKYKTDLLTLWDKFTEFQSRLLEQTTIITYGNIRQYIKKLPTKSLDKAPAIREWLLKNTTRYMVWYLLKHFSQCCVWAEDSGLIPNNPFQRLKIKKPRKSSQENEECAAFSLEERDLIIKAFESDKSHNHYAPFVKFLFWSGCRIGEACALTWGDVQQNCTRIQINKSYTNRVHKGTKNNKKRTFPVSEGSQLQRLLLSIKPSISEFSSSRLVFTTKTGKQMNRLALTKVWTGASVTKNGKLHRYPGVVTTLAAYGSVRYLRPYSTRHTWATWAIASGVSPALVALWMGDEVETVLKYYCHPEVIVSECPDF